MVNHVDDRVRVGGIIECHQGYEEGEFIKIIGSYGYAEVVRTRLRASGTPIIKKENYLCRSMLLKTLPLFWKPFEKGLLVFSLLAAVLGFSGVESIVSGPPPQPVNTELRVKSVASESDVYSYRKALRNTKKNTFFGFFSQNTVKIIQVLHQATYKVVATQAIALCPESRILAFVQRKNNPSPAEENSAPLS